MINLNELLDSIRPLLFGNVSIKEYTKEVIVYCNLDDNIKVYAKLIIDKKTDIINIAFLNNKNTSERFIALRKLNYIELVKLLNKFKEYNKTYGYDTTIKISSKIINNGEDQ